MMKSESFDPEAVTHLEDYDASMEKAMPMLPKLYELSLNRELCPMCVLEWFVNQCSYNLAINVPEEEQDKMLLLLQKQMLEGWNAGLSVKNGQVGNA